ncbi:Uncharacterised protein [uncultured archaeon]|nr:Uncharacterised protein [uncultured archaeon]
MELKFADLLKEFNLNSSILLNGSRAKGIARIDSDYDFFYFISLNDLSKLKDLPNFLNSRGCSEFVDITDQVIALLQCKFITIIALKGKLNDSEISLHISLIDFFDDNLFNGNSKTLYLRTKQRLSKEKGKNYRISFTNGSFKVMNLQTILNDSFLILDRPSLFIEGKYTSLPTTPVKLIPSIVLYDNLDANNKIILNSLKFIISKIYEDYLLVLDDQRVQELIYLILKQDKLDFSKECIQRISDRVNLALKEKLLITRLTT